MIREIYLNESSRTTNHLIRDSLTALRLCRYVPCYTMLQKIAERCQGKWAFVKLVWSTNGPLNCLSPSLALVTLSAGGVRT